MDFLDIFEYPALKRTDSSDLFDLFISGSVRWRDPVILFGTCEARSLNVSCEYLSALSHTVKSNASEFSWDLSAFSVTI